MATSDLKTSKTLTRTWTTPQNVNRPYFTFRQKGQQGRSQYEANRGTCLSHLRFDPGSVLFKRGHHKDPE